MADEVAGLSASEAAHRLRERGPNVLPRARPPSSARLAVAQLTHFFALLLWGAAVLAWVGGMPQLAVATVAVVIVNGAFAFAQEHRADRAGQRLLDLMPARATVVRDGRRRLIDARDVVVGDLLVLEAGDAICADARLAGADGFAVDASALTGESAATHPATAETVRAGTYVLEGEATAEATATGEATELAQVVRLTRRSRRSASPLDLRLRRVVRTIAGIAIAIGGTFFAVTLVLDVPPSDGFLFAVGVAVALVPEGLLPTVTLSLARGAQRMAASNALVRRLDAVETLGATTFVCTDKTGTLTRNEMSVVAVWTPRGAAEVVGHGYAPTGRITAVPGRAGTGAATAADHERDVRAAVRDLALGATRCSTGRLLRSGETWTPHGDPMEVALHVLALRAGVDVAAAEAARPVRRRLPFDARRRRMSVLAGDRVFVKGAPDAVVPLTADPGAADDALAELTGRGLRVLAVAARPARESDVRDRAARVEAGLGLLGLVALQDPVRDDVHAAVASCRAAGIRLAMLTGDHRRTAAAVAREVGLCRGEPTVVEGAALPADDDALGRLVDRDGLVVARVTPEDKLRIARALRARGHVVAMTGDGVNDAPALREADVGVAMGRGGSDVAREAADVVLLDDAFGSIVAAVELGRATFSNIRKFLTYHLTDNVAELTPFLVWALSGGSVPLALTVLQILALDIGTDLLPALALGAEPPDRRTMGPRERTGALVDRRVLLRVFGVLGPAEAAVEMAAFVAVLGLAGWSLGADVSATTLALASGAAFTAVVLGQLGNVFACRSEHRWAGALPLGGNHLLLTAVVVGLLLLGLFLSAPLSEVLGGSPPPAVGWAVAGFAPVLVVLADAADKAARRRAHRGRRRGSGRSPLRSSS
ncbi:cation-transporting P-type ATPase [Isoptericola sp. BMS4]|uniref:cation-translocating P-type ATPase n=1 Tax=Isoptericola sp. BMS4 TaxID=2527875 RepID=UPI001F10973C|nr:cation-transporting P-type ATPase [Isoptericola sp. BMS4]